MPFPIIPVIMGAVSLASSIIAARAGKKQTNKTAQANMDLAKYQAQANEQFIDKQNAYNTPAMQMGRYNDAGLNPNLIYGQGSSGNQESPARYEAPHVDYHFNPFQIPEVLGPFQDYQMREAQIDNVKANTESTRTEIGNKLLDRLLTQVNTSRQEFDLGQAKNLAPYSLDLKRQQNNQAHQKVMMNMLKMTEMEFMNKIRAEQVKQAPLRSDQMSADLLFSQYRNQWMKMGITSSDHFLIRAIARAMQSGSPVIQFNKGKMDADLGIK